MAFSRPEAGLDPFHEHPVLFVILFVTVIVGLVMVRRLEDWFDHLAKNNRYVRRIVKNRPIVRRFGESSRWTLCIVALAISLYLFWPMASLLWEITITGGYCYIGFCALAGYLVWRVIQRRADYVTGGIETPFLARVACIVLVLGYLSIVTFAYRVYPYVPVHRGGGDYTTEAWSIIHFDDKLSKQIPLELIDPAKSPFQSKMLIVLRETPTTFYLTVPTSKAEVGAWRNSGRRNKPKTIYTIRRDAIVSVSYINPDSP
jgi:hypothetical protein